MNARRWLGDPKRLHVLECILRDEVFWDILPPWHGIDEFMCVLYSLKDQNHDVDVGVISRFI